MGWVTFNGCAQKETTRLEKDADFKALCTSPLYQKYGNVKALKVIYRLKEEKIYFINGNKYNFHYEFVLQNFNPYLNLNQFNEANYGKTKSREYLLGNINYYVDQDRYVLEIGPSDQIPAELLLKLFNAVKDNSFFGNKLVFFSNTTNAQKISEELEGLPTISADEIYKGQQYQPIHKGKNKGTLKIITDLQKQEADIKPTDILILNETPVYLPICAGIIVNQFQTPLSHVSILGKSRNIPVCADKRLLQRTDLTQLIGKWVELTVTQDTFKLIITHQTPETKNGKKLKLKYDLKVTELVDLTEHDKKMKNAIGTKAYNFSKLVEYTEFIDFKTPENAFAIPFYFYEQHALKSDIQKLIFLLNGAKREEQLKTLNLIRTKILATEVDESLIEKVKQKISTDTFTRMRFRSSTNAEDLANFSGAGLYTSTTGIVNNQVKSIELAIKKVWASTWSNRAFFEREIYNISSEDVKMGILVHRSFPNEEVNGVAITTNLYRKNYLGFVINCQQGDINVVNQYDTIQPEQMLIYPVDVFANEVNNYDVIAYSSLSENKLIMTDEEINHLANVLERIKEKYYRNHFVGGNYYDFALDIEFKLDRKTRQFYIKQMREY